MRAHTSRLSRKDRIGGLLLLGVIASLCMPTSALASWTAVEAGYSSYAIRNDGALYAWGGNTDGRLGDGSGLGQQLKPVRVGTATWKSIAAGVGHTAGIRSAGTLWTWGSNGWGQLGLVDSGGKVLGPQATPMQVGTGMWKAVDGSIHTLAIAQDGSLWGWGHNASGQIGNDRKVAVNTPVRVGTSSSWVAVAAGGQRSYGIQKDGSLWAWGDNRNGRLGTGGYDDASVPLPIGAATGWKAVSAGGGHTLAVRTDGTLWSWGTNGYGELGDGTKQLRPVPTQVGTGKDWAAVSAGGSHSLALKQDGSLWAWGLGSSGRLGDGTTEGSLTPKRIGGTWKAVSAGNEHSLGIATDGSVWAWGRGDQGQLGTGVVVPIDKPILAPRRILEPVLPKVALGKPALSVKSPKAKKSFTVSATLKPRAKAKSTPVIMRFYTSKGQLVKSVKAKAANYSTYSKVSAKTSLSPKGSYYVVAEFPKTSKYAKTTSAKLSFEVK